MPLALDKIVAELTRPPQDSRPIKDVDVRRWMKETDSEVRGATCSLLMESRHANRITPPLHFDEVFDWASRYYEWCLRTDPQGEWVDTRWTAASDTASWFIVLWDEGRDRSYLDQMKALLADLYVKGSPDLRDALEHGCLEHLFERRDIREFFGSWKRHPQLVIAYEEASRWSRNDGKSPLAKPKKRRRRRWERDKME